MGSEEIAPLTGPRTTTGAAPARPTARGMLPVARALLASPDRSAVSRWLTAGHRPGSDGRCRHPVHATLSEVHPCPMLRVVALTERLAEERDARS